jgi:hypothetical protein
LYRRNDDYGCHIFDMNETEFRRLPQFGAILQPLGLATGQNDIIVPGLAILMPVSFTKTELEEIMALDDAADEALQQTKEAAACVVCSNPSKLSCVDCETLYCSQACRQEDRSDHIQDCAGYESSSDDGNDEPVEDDVASILSDDSCASFKSATSTTPGEADEQVDDATGIDANDFGGPAPTSAGVDENDFGTFKSLAPTSATVDENDFGAFNGYDNNDNASSGGYAPAVDDDETGKDFFGSQEEQDKWNAECSFDDTPTTAIQW